MADQLSRLGQFLFNIRNGLFPVVIIALIVLWPPVAIGDSLGDFLYPLGFLCIITGQLIRILTIGLDYIVRGGRNRKIYAENLVTGGVFGHSRNPMYVGNILLAIGCLFVSGNLTAILVGSTFFLIFYWLIVHSEETFLRSKFGTAYQEYCADVPRWIPHIKDLGSTIREFEFDWPGVVVKEYGTIFVAMMIPLTLFTWKLYLANQLNDNWPILLSLALLFFAAFATARILKKKFNLTSLRSRE
jgi:protein-S-isoprenylcysteine O-methyltransferase Ste14